MMTRKFHLLLLCTLFGVPAEAKAVQGGLPASPVELVDLNPWTRTWPPLVATTNVGRAVSGDFTGDGTPDVWQQTSTGLVLFMDPSFMDCTCDIAVTATSMARLPRSGTQTQDRLVIVGASGLSTVDFTPGSATPLTITPLAGVPSVVPVGSSSWVNASSLSCTDLDLDGDLDLLAISAAGNKLVRLINDGQGNYSYAPDIAVPAGSFEAFSMIYDQGQPQIAVLSSSWMIIIQQGGVRSKFVASNSAFGHIAKITQASSPNVTVTDCVVWLQDVSGGGGNQQVSIIDNKTSQQAPVQLGPMNATAIFSGDIDANGSDDFGVVTKLTRVAYKYTNQRSTPSSTVDRFSNSFERAISLSGSAAPAPLENTSTPLLADLNFDRKADLFAVDRNVPQALAIITDPPQPPSGEPAVGGHPCFFRADYYPASVFTNICWTDTTALLGGGVLTLQVNNPWNLPNPATGWRMELVMYRQEAYPADVTPMAVQRYEYDLSGANFRILPTASSAIWNFPVKIDEPAPNDAIFPQKFYILLRPIAPSGNSDSGPLTQYLIGFTSQADVGTSTQNPLYYLLHLAGSWPAGIAYDRLSCPHAFGIEISGAVPLMRVPPYVPAPPLPSPGPLVEPPGLPHTP